MTSPRRLRWRWGRAGVVPALALAAALLAPACGGGPARPAESIDGYRAAAREDGDDEALGRWLLAELYVPGGTAPQANLARDRLKARRDRGAIARLALAIDHEQHGRLRDAARGYVDAFGAARASDRAEAEMVAWYATRRLLELRPSVPDLWSFARAVVEPAVARPGRIGFRAHGDAVELWSLEELAPARMAAAARGEPPPSEALGDVVARSLGCATEARFAGPFGRGVSRELGTAAVGEAPGAWPVVFPATHDRIAPARVLGAERRGCKLVAAEATQEGVHLVETFFELSSTTEVILTVQAAHAVRVDDVLVLERRPEAWGVWPRFGVRLQLGPGRHRVVARLPQPETSIRILDASGAPLPVTTSADPVGGSVADPPEILPDPNPTAAFLDRVGVEPGRAPRMPRAFGVPDTADLTLRVLAAELAHADGQDDLATVLLEPLVTDPSRATGPALAAAARYLEQDPVFAPGDAHDLAKDFRQRAVEKDPHLWFPRLWLALDLAQKEGPRALGDLRALAKEFPEAPAIAVALANAYAQLGWKVEHEAAVRDAARRFPHDPHVLRALLRVMDASGEDPAPIEARLRAADPRAPVDAERAVLRGDWATAVRELERFAASDPDRGDVDARIDDLRRRAGTAPETLATLERAVLRDPRKEDARLALADARLAAGDGAALPAAIARARGEGLSADALREALETSTGATLLEPFRRDGLAIVRAYEESGEAAGALARSATGRGGAAHAARVLDYAAVWVHEDGTARMLEHEILHMQSGEAIAEHAEQRIPQGTVLRVRTIKADGRVLEPEIVAGDKKTVTMPHLDIGDYVETETIYQMRGDGRGGASWLSPRWFFREAKIDYHVSEFVIVAPRSRALEIETRGEVPPPTIRDDGALRIHTWRVERSPALPDEPASVPPEEYLPSVRAGWGIDRALVIQRFVDAANAPVPADPRLRRIARTIATAGEKPRPGESLDTLLARVPLDERARRIYRWVVENVENGEVTDPRRIVVGKEGSRPEAFAYLCRLAGVTATHALVRDKLEPEATTGLSRATELDRLAVRVTTSQAGDRHRWLVIADRFVPYGYMPAELRGQPAVLLSPGAQAVTTDAGGSEDAVTHAGTARLRADGSATLELRQTYQGRLAIGLRGALESLPDARLEEAIEQKLLPPLIPGARLASLTIENRDALDAPLTLVMKLEVSAFARVEGRQLVIAPPFGLGLGAYARLPRRETPLLLAEAAARRFAVQLRLELPRGASVTSRLDPVAGEDAGRRFRVSDRVEKGVLVLDREATIPAGRVTPAEYREFATFALSADQAFDRDVVITLE